MLDIISFRLLSVAVVVNYVVAIVYSYTIIYATIVANNDEHKNTTIIVIKREKQRKARMEGKVTSFRAVFLANVI